MEPSIRGLHPYHPERRRSSRTRRNGRCRPFPRINLGARVLGRVRKGPPRWRDETTPFPALPPPCPYCGGLTRPGVVWFGEGIDGEVISRSLEATDCDLFLTVGTSALVHPAAGLLQKAKTRGAFTVEVNLESTPASDLVDLTLHGPAERLLADVEDARPK